MNKPGVGRMQVWIDCTCGAEIEITDVEPDGSTYETVTCDDCGAEFQMLVEVEIS